MLGAVQDEVQKQGGCSYWQDWAFPIKPELLEKFACEVHLILCISGCPLFFGGGVVVLPSSAQDGWQTLCNLFWQFHGSLLKPRIAMLLVAQGPTWPHLVPQGVGGWAFLCWLSNSPHHPFPILEPHLLHHEMIEDEQESLPVCLIQAKLQPVAKWARACASRTDTCFVG